jgi:hypothetical protein
MSRMTLLDKEAFLARCQAAGAGYPEGSVQWHKNQEQLAYWREEIAGDKRRIAAAEEKKRTTLN